MIIIPYLDYIWIMIINAVLETATDFGISNQDD